MKESVVVIPQNKGQIMFPKKWRDQLNAPAFHAEFDGTRIVMSPLYPSQLGEVREYSTEKEEGLIFPQGVDPCVFLESLEKIDG
jgi:bifunctional DNA-binding transcriptional regulator/antitoxin component of YhaV-PrlF toxin-antitoxin module